jgi:phosphoribosylglycinamide formyltransferase
MADHLPPAHAPPPTKITVLISGNGSNLQALIDATTTGLLPSTTIIRVISNKKDAYGLTRAEKAGIPTAYHNLIFGKYLKSGEKDPEVIRKGRKAYDADLADLVPKDKPDLVVCVSCHISQSCLYGQSLPAAHIRTRLAGCTS